MANTPKKTMCLLCANWERLEPSAADTIFIFWRRWEPLLPSDLAHPQTASPAPIRIKSHIQSY